MAARVPRREPGGASCWPLAVSAGLLGLGQNGLLVALPVLINETRLSLSVWAGLLTLGSTLFLPASPRWGRVISRRGGKPVVHVALGGFTASFALLGLTCLLLAAAAIDVPAGLALLVLARIGYGLTVSGMVPACQTWALQRAGEERRMAALAAISSGLSGGRLFGPLAAAGMLAWHPLAPLGLLVIAPLAAWLLILPLAGDPPRPRGDRPATRPTLACLPYLACALLLAAGLSLMQLGLAPTVRPLLGGDDAQVGRHVAGLLSLAALASLTAQFAILRPQRLTPRPLLTLAGLLLVTGLTLMVSRHVPLVYLGCGVLSFGAALATPAYQLLVNDRMDDGAGAGWVAASHTLGYALSALLVPTVATVSGDSALMPVALATAVAFLVVSVWIRFERARPVGDSGGGARPIRG
ncbi:MFS transporter [Micromonospora sp. HUAS LYJ1]|uniref:MFS transporter n=1 Tax=Micromonospora sp. HUAS LYJ1 TaxID=3061626 RepID=UPI002670D90F|nr:MFS transporter [Micromonospora sp. HUAS LYJ1]WKU07143.1 MFS transporter [Micromonospora sp. HUAS LYJ1]